MNIRFAGFGGQGIVVAGYVVGQAAVLDGRNALQTQSYGSESRGGTCKSDVTISDEPILDLAPSGCEVLIAMSQPALEKFLPDLNEDGLLIYDSDLVKAGDNARGAHALPATQVATQTYGREVVANVIMVGYLTGLTNVASPESFRKAIAHSVPPKTVDLNLKAFDDGLKRGCGDRGRSGMI